MCYLHVVDARCVYDAFQYGFSVCLSVFLGAPYPWVNVSFASAARKGRAARDTGGVVACWILRAADVQDACCFIVAYRA